MEEIKVNLENLNEEERKTLMKIIEKANKPNSKMWKPQIGETYYFMFSDGEVEKSIGISLSEGQKRYALGNCFKTREEAEFEAERLKVLTQWKRLSIESGEDDNPWDAEHGHWYAGYDTDNKRICYCRNSTMKNSEVYFPTAEAARNAVEAIGEENVKRYILGVKE